MRSKNLKNVNDKKTYCNYKSGSVQTEQMQIRMQKNMPSGETR